MSYSKTSSLFCFLLIGLTNCSVMEPLDQSYHWRPHNVYNQNIIAQVEDKKDLVKGRYLAPSDANTAITAIQRWRDDNMKKLGNTGLAELNSTGSSDDSSSGGAVAASGAAGGQ